MTGAAVSTLASASRAMVAGVTKLRARTLDALFNRPDHKASVAELAKDLGIGEQEVLGLRGAVVAELRGVFARPRLQRFLDPDLRDEVLAELSTPLLAAITTWLCFIRGAASASSG